MRLIPFIFASLLFQISNAQAYEMVEAKEIRSVVDYLASDALSGRETATQGEFLAAQFIQSKFIESGIKPYFKTYIDSFRYRENKGLNIVGFIEGNDADLKNEVVLIGAHYDHIGFKRRIGSDSIANGANDNASGTAAVLAIAKRIAQAGTNKRSLIIALFSGEEKGLLGSKALAKKIKEQNINLYTMLNFEMLGVPFTDRNYDVFLTGFSLSNLGAKLNTYTNSAMVGSSAVAEKYGLFKRSDNYAFYKKFKVPCHTISSCDLTNFDFYHHVEDEIDKLDFTFMAAIINKLIPGILEICNTNYKEIQMN
tara:strand:+ start:925 stop:1854 length:930 start_codon:yes stop_codon:yes gene_type:complete